MKYQKRIQNPVKHQNGDLQKQLMAFSHVLRVSECAFVYCVIR